ncbi:MAG: sulfatase [Candidatus Glassbacteria bacterium]|nr:sulfatase [Candidatus Glassbacteria bacterium]
MSRLSRRDFLASLAALGVSSALPAQSVSPGSRRGRPNVLFIAVDDLRPQLGCYGATRMLTPHIDSLAADGVVFERAFCSVPVCGASRASLMAGLRPTRGRFTNYYSMVDQDAPGVATLPDLFRRNGYNTVSLGKIYHSQQDDPDGWVSEPWRASPEHRYLLEENRAISEGNWPETGQGRRGPAWEAAAVDDDAYPDGIMTSRAIGELEKFSRSGEPFFLATGFVRPHLPFNSPKRYWDLYDRLQLNLARNPFRPEGAPDAALHNFGELRQYHGIPQTGPLPDGMALELIHGYYASVSYVDAQIGRLMGSLRWLGLERNTVVVLWGDHGWQLGEHGLWCKHCNFQTSLRAPLIVRAPWIPGGKKTSALTEFVDIYPSLCELCGLEAPIHLEGSSFVPLLIDPKLAWKQAVFSRYNDGDSVRTDRYLYTQWTNSAGEVYARMLYDHHTDPQENVNIAELPANRDVVARMTDLLDRGWRSQVPGR